MKNLIFEFINYLKTRRIKKTVSYLSSISNGNFSFLDIGARGGIVTSDKNFLFFKNFLNFYSVGIEPDPEECERIKHEYNEVYPIAVSDKKTTTALYITKNPACASLFEPNEKIYHYSRKKDDLRVIKKININVDRVDNILDNKEFDFIKTDVQGATYEVLMGTGKILDNAFGCYLDVYFEDAYRNIKKFDLVDSYLRSKGFRIISLLPVFPDGFMWQANMTYIRIPNYVDRSIFIKLFTIASITNNQSLQGYLFRVYGKVLNSIEYSNLLKVSNINKKYLKMKSEIKWSHSDWRGIQS